MIAQKSKPKKKFHQGRKVDVTESNKAERNVTEKDSIPMKMGKNEQESKRSKMSNRLDSL